MHKVTVLDGVRSQTLNPSINPKPSTPNPNQSHAVSAGFGGARVFDASFSLFRCQNVGFCVRDLNSRGYYKTLNLKLSTLNPNNNNCCYYHEYDWGKGPDIQKL